MQYYYIFILFLSNYKLWEFYREEREEIKVVNTMRAVKFAIKSLKNKKHKTI